MASIPKAGAHYETLAEADLFPRLMMNTVSDI